MSDDLERLIAEEVDAAGYDVVELRRRGTRSRPVIEVRIDRRDEGKVTVDDCATVSRRVEKRLDDSGLVADNYELQVSSPGDRPLRTVADWRRFVGRWTNVLSPAHGGRFEARIVAVEGEAGAEELVLDLGKGGERRVPLAAVEEARLAFRI
jgi:ribosome maturation factor RimP